MTLPTCSQFFRSRLCITGMPGKYENVEFTR